MNYEKMWKELKFDAKSMGTKEVSYKDVLDEMRLIEGESRGEPPEIRRIDGTKESKKELDGLKSLLLWYIIGK